MSPSKRATLAACAAAIIVGATLATAPAATPSEVSVGPRRPKATWTGGPMTNANVSTLEGVECPSKAQDPMDGVCDHVILKVEVPTSHWRSSYGGVRISLKNSGGGLQLFVYDSAGRIVGEGDAGTLPSAYIPNASGTYEIRVNPEVSFLQDYQGEVVFTSKKGRDPGFPRHTTAAFKPRAFDAQPQSLPQNAAVRYRGPALAFQAHYVGRRAAEPTIGIDPKGAVLFPAGAFDALPSQSPRQLAHTLYMASFDKGRHFTVVQPPLVPGTQTEGEPFTLDPYVYVDKDTGRWFGVDLKGAGTSIHFSDDQGQTWTRGHAANVGFNDHQTLTSGVVPAGAALVTTDSAFPKVVYYCSNQVYSAMCTRSLDGGVTFQPAGQAYPPADPSAEIPFCGALHGHVIADPQGRLFIPRGHCGKPYISFSEDAGLTWTVVKVSDRIGAADTQTSVASDAAGNLYFVWHDDEHLMPYLSVSTDHGRTWSRPRMIAPPGVREVTWPSVVAGDKGRIAVTFPGTPSSDLADLSRPWNQYVVMSTNALDRDPLFVSAVANPGGPGDPIHRGKCQNRCGNIYDFIDIESAPDATGTIWVATTDTCTTLFKCST
ncbi:MAG: sialidase family protein, partial [Actinomycetota bacterium]